MAAPQTNYSKHNIVIPDTPNTKMYLELSRTDPSATKPFQKRGGFSGTAIDPAWRWMRLTEYFGPCGQGWGAEQLAFHIAEGIAFVCVRLWYRVPNEDGSMGTGEQCWTPPQWGGSELVKVMKGYTATSDEALKMAMTDAMGKCAGMFLGLGADIYLGSFEDDKYREESEVFYKTKANPELTPVAIAKSEEELAEKLAAITDLKALDDLWTDGTNARIKEIGTAGASGKEARQRMISAFTAKKNELLALQNDRQEEPPADDQEQDGHQPSLQELADRDQEEHMRHIEQEEAAATLNKPAQPAKTAQVDLSPEKIKQFEEWVSRKLTGVKDTRELDAFWGKDCAPRVLLIKERDENAHRRISAAYVKRMRELGGSFKRVSGQD
jgi:hypothetical protein